MNTERQASKQQDETQDGFAGVVYEVGRGGRTAILIGLVGQLIRIGLQILLGRTLGAHAYGLYTLGRTVLEVLAQLGGLGLQNGVIQFIAVFRGQGDEARVRGTILAALALVAITSGLIGGGLWWAADWAANYFFNEPALGPVLRGFAVALPFYVVLLLLTACARGFRHIAYYSGMTNVVHPLGVLIFTGGAFLIGMRLEGIVWGFALSTGLACGLMLHWTMRLFPELWHLKKGCLFASSRILPYSIKVLFNDFLHRILSHTDRLMLGAFGAASDVGIYSMSAFMGSKIDFFQGTFNSIFAPTIADLYSRGKYRELVRIFQTVTKWTLVLTLPVFFACLFLGHWILELFGREFQAGWSTLVVLAVANLINIGVGPVGYMLVMTERPGLEFVNSWIAGVANILLNLLLIPHYGALGAAIATGSAIAMVNLLRLAQVQRIHHCHPFRWSTLKVLMAWALAGGTVWTLSHVYHLEDWRRLVAMAGFLFAYGGLLTMFGWDEEDKLVLRQLRRKVRVWLA